MNTIVIIPARYASTRYPGKPLVELKGSDGITKTLIQRTWETACAVPGVSGIFVATDDQRIAARVQDFGGKVIMTGESRSEEHTSELQSLMRISYAVFCLKKKKNNKHIL